MSKKKIIIVLAVLLMAQTASAYEYYIHNPGDCTYRSQTESFGTRSGENELTVDYRVEISGYWENPIGKVFEGGTKIDTINFPTSRDGSYDGTKTKTYNFNGDVTIEWAVDPSGYCGAGDHYYTDLYIDSSSMTSTNSPPNNPTNLAPSGSGVDVSPTISASYSDPDGDSGTLYFETGGGSSIGSCSVSDGGSCSVTYSGANSWGASYTFQVYAQDSAGATSGTVSQSFTTNYRPSVSNLQPSGSPVQLDPQLSADVSDSDGECMTVTFRDASDNSNIGSDSVCGSGTATVSTSGVSLGSSPGTTYNFDVVVSEDDGQTSVTSGDQSFTTVSNPNTPSLNAPSPSGVSGVSLGSALSIGDAGRVTGIGSANWASATIDRGFDQVPHVFATTQTTNGGQDPSEAHVANVSVSGFETQHCEYDGGDTCDGHAKETNAWFAVDPSDVSDASGWGTGIVNIDSGSGNYNINYGLSSTPLLFATPQTNNGQPTLNTRFDSVTSGGATLSFCEQQSTDSCESAHANEDVAWLALDPSQVTEKGGFEYGTFTTSDSSWNSISFNQTFDVPPAVIADVQTTNGQEAAVYAEVDSVDTNGASIRFCESDGNDGCDAHTSEKVAWMAVEPSALGTDVYHPDGLAMDVDFYIDQGSDGSYETTLTANNVNSGGTASVNPSLNGGTSYTWYARARTDGYSTSRSNSGNPWSFTTNYVPSVDSISKTDSSSGHAFSSVSAVVSDPDGEGDISSSNLNVNDGVSYTDYSPNSIDTSYGNGNQAEVTFGPVDVSDGSNWGPSDSMQLTVSVTDSESNTASSSINRQFPNHAPTVASGYSYSDDHQNHAFTLNIDSQDVDDGAGEITSCSVEHNDGDGNSYSNSGSLAQGETATCSFTIDDSYSGYKYGEMIDHRVTFQDAHGKTVTTTWASHSIPNSPPSATNLRPSGTEVSYGPTLNATYNDPNGDSGNLTFYNTSSYIVDKYASLDQNVWSLSGSASYDSSNSRIQLNAGGGATSGNVEMVKGLKTDKWVSDFKFTNGADGADEVAFSFYASGMSSSWTPSEGYLVSYDHWDDQVRLDSFSGGSSTTLASKSLNIGSGTFNGKIRYDKGHVEVYFEGEKKVDYTISSPDQSASGFYISARDGGSAGAHYLEQISLSQIENQVGTTNSLSSGQSATVQWNNADQPGTNYNFTVKTYDGVNKIFTTENFTTIYEPKAPYDSDPSNESTVDTTTRTGDEIAASVKVVHPDGRPMNVEFINRSNGQIMEIDYNVGSGDRAKITNIGNSLRDETNETYKWKARSYDTGTGEYTDSNPFVFSTVEVGQVMFDVMQGADGDNMDVTGNSDNGWTSIEFGITSSQMDPIPKVTVNETSTGDLIKSWSNVDNNSVLSVNLDQSDSPDWNLNTDSQYEYFIEASEGPNVIGQSLNHTIYTYNVSLDWNRAERYYDVYQYDVYRAQDTGSNLIFDYGSGDYNLVGSLPETSFNDSGPGLETGTFCWRVAASNPSGSSDAIPVGDGKCKTLN